MPQGHAAEAAKPWGRLLHIILGQRHCGGVGAQRIEINIITTIKIAIVIIFIIHIPSIIINCVTSTNLIMITNFFEFLLLISYVISHSSSFF